MDSYYIQTKFLRIFGGAFWFKDMNDQVVAYSKQKRFKLKEDIVLYSDETCTQPLISIKARSVIDFGATYDIVDMTTGENLGAARRKGLKSIFKDTWKILDANGNEYVGEFKNNEMNGQGTYTFADGSKYVGEFKNGLRNGLGTYTTADGEVVDGIWENGEFVERTKLQSLLFMNNKVINA